MAKTIQIAGDELNKNITQYARDVFNLLLGERVAEEVKMSIGTAIEWPEPLQGSMRGRDLVSGLPKEISVNDAQIREAIGRSIKALVEHIKGILETTPPELVADIYKHGIMLTGGGALLKGIDQAISRGTGLPVHIAEAPEMAVVRGTGVLLENEALLKDVGFPATDSVALMA
jgi:rod shape-determining protein MreB